MTFSFFQHLLVYCIGSQIWLNLFPSGTVCNNTFWGIRMLFNKWYKRTYCFRGLLFVKSVELVGMRTRGNGLLWTPKVIDFSCTSWARRCTRQFSFLLGKRIYKKQWPLHFIIATAGSQSQENRGNLHLFEGWNFHWTFSFAFLVCKYCIPSCPAWRIRIQKVQCMAHYIPPQFCFVLSSI